MKQEEQDEIKAKSKHLFKKWLLTMGLLAIFIQPAIAYSPYSEIAAQLARDAMNILVRHKVCTDPNRDCLQQERIKMGGTPNHAVLFVYRANELKPEVIMDLMTLCLNTYNKANRQKTIELKIYVATHDKQVALFSGAEPVIHLIFKGDE